MHEVGMDTGIRVLHFQMQVSRLASRLPGLDKACLLDARRIVRSCQAADGVHVVDDRELLEVGRTVLGETNLLCRRTSPPGQTDEEKKPRRFSERLSHCTPSVVAYSAGLQSP
jgi:hypothetical protein